MVLRHSKLRGFNPQAARLPFPVSARAPPARWLEPTRWAEAKAVSTPRNGGDAHLVRGPARMPAAGRVPPPKGVDTGISAAFFSLLGGCAFLWTFASSFFCLASGCAFLGTFALLGLAIWRPSRTSKSSTRARGARRRRWARLPLPLSPRCGSA